MKLYEKYSPTTLDDVVIEEVIIDPIIAWANLWLNKLPDPSRPALLLVGHPGIGKTLTSRVLCKDCDWNLIELNASDVRSKEKLSKFNFHSHDMFGRLNCILFDEIDSLDKGGEIVIRRFIAQCKYPVILTANKMKKVSNEIMKLCETIQMRRPSVNSLKNHVLKILSKEKLSVDNELIEEAAKIQDFRMALEIIESKMLLKQLKRRLTLIENTRNLFNGEEVDFEDTKSLMYYIEENCGQLYDIVEKDKLFEQLTRVDKFRKRNQKSFAIESMKRIQRPNNIALEIRYPVFLSKKVKGI